MIVWNVFDSAGLYQLTCTSEEIAKKAAERFGIGWSMVPVETDFCDAFGEMALYVVAVKDDSTEIKAMMHREPRRYGYINPVPKVTRYERVTEVALLAKDARDAIYKALEILNGKEEHI